uniref:Uncharacterized protein n=2 Tax=Opuntia streptacantha TaxID=393608 RepID=A0A7C8YEU7_OPUST
MEGDLLKWKNRTSKAAKLNTRGADQMQSRENMHPSDSEHKSPIVSISECIFLGSCLMCSFLSLNNSRMIYKFQPLVISVMFAFSCSLAAVMNPQRFWFSRICGYFSVTCMASAITLLLFLHCFQ